MKIKDQYKSQYKIYAEEGEEGIVKEVFADSEHSYGRKFYHVKVDIGGHIKTFRQSSVDLVERIEMNKKTKNNDIN